MTREALYEWLDRESGTRYEYSVTPEAGITLATPSEKWWGTRFRFRAVGERRWRTFIAVNVHPFDSLDVDAAIAAHITAPKTLARVLS